MGCFSNKTDDHADEKCGMVPSSGRKCRDTFCCILFIVYWLGMLVVAIVGFQRGSPESLVYGKDFNGNICGDEDANLTDKKLLYFPKINEDVLYATKNNIALTKMNYYGICVESCPQSGEERCGYNSTNCYTSHIDTKELLYRCLPLQPKNESIEWEACIDPPTANASCNVFKYIAGDCNEICKVRNQKIISYEKEETVKNPVVEQMQGIVHVLATLMGDVERTYDLVLLVGGVGAFVLGILWLIIIQLFAGFMIWITFLSLIVLLILLSLYCSVKGDIIDASKFNLSFLNDDLVQGLETAKGFERQQFEIAGYILWPITIIVLFIVFASFKRIRMTISIIKEASHSVRKMPLLVIWPFFPAILSIGFIIYWIIIAAHILTADKISFSEVASTVSSALNTNEMVEASSTSSAGEALFLYHLFGILWTNQFIQAISVCTIAGAVAQYYWTKPDQFGNRDLGRFPIASALKRTLRFHLGSLCFGSFIIALVQFIRLILEYIDHHTKTLQDKNCAIRIIMKMVKCILWCFEKCLKFLSKNAYILIAMKGRNFFNSAKSAFTLILSNIAKFALVNTGSYILMLFARLTITAGAGITIFIIISKTKKFEEGEESEISSPFAPTLVTCLLAWFVATSFMNVLDIAIDTILISFCEDIKLNNDGASEYMTPSLQKLMGGKPSEATRTVHVQEKPNEPQI